MTKAQELDKLIERAKKADDKKAQRARQAVERATAALAPNPSGYRVPDMPAGLTAQRRWLRAGHDAYSRREIGLLELTEMRRSVSTQAETYKAGAIVRQSFAAERAAMAQERLVETLAALEHGGAALAMLVKLQDGLTEGKRRPLPGRLLNAVQATPSPAEPA